MPESTDKNTDVFVAALTAVPLFANLQPASLEALVEASSIERAAAGAMVVREGDAGNALFIVKAGLFEVVTGTGPHSRMVRRLHLSARTANAREEVGLMNPAALLGTLQRVGEGLHAPFLPDKIGQQAGTVFEGECSHGFPSLPQGGRRRHGSSLASRRSALSGNLSFIL